MWKCICQSIKLNPWRACHSRPLGPLSYSEQMVKTQHSYYDAVYQRCRTCSTAWSSKLFRPLLTHVPILRCRIASQTEKNIQRTSIHVLNWREVKSPERKMHTSAKFKGHGFFQLSTSSFPMRPDMMMLRMNNNLLDCCFRQGHARTLCTWVAWNSAKPHGSVQNRRSIRGTKSSLPCFLVSAKRLMHCYTKDNSMRLL